MTETQSQSNTETNTNVSLFSADLDGSSKETAKETTRGSALNKDEQGVSSGFAQPFDTKNEQITSDNDKEQDFLDETGDEDPHTPQNEDGDNIDDGVSETADTDESDDQDSESENSEESEKEDSETPENPEFVNIGDEQVPFETIEQVYKERQSVTKKARNVSTVAKENSSIRRANEKLQENYNILEDALVQILAAEGSAPLSPSEIRSMTDEQVAAEESRRKQNDEQLIARINQIKGLREGIPAYNQQTAKTMEDLVISASMEDDRYAEITDTDSFRKVFDENYKMLREVYSFDEDTAKTLLIGHNDLNTVDAIMDLREYQKIKNKNKANADKKKPLPVKQRGKNKTTSNNATPSTSQGGNIGFPKDKAEIDRRWKQMETWEKKGIVLTPPEQDAYVNEGKLPKRRR